MAANSVRQRVFSVSSANRTLPLVRAIVRDVIELSRELRDRRELLGSLRKPRKEVAATGQSAGDAYGDEVRQAKRELQQGAEQLDRFTNELSQVGAILRDPLDGIVDFPTLLGSEEGFLTWTFNAPTVGFWHPASTNFTERIPLEAVGLEAV